MKPAVNHVTQHPFEKPPAEGKKPKRMHSLDAFRGFTIAAMILVNTPASEEHVFVPLAHSAWNGVTPADYIFPFFVFIVGISITLSFSKLLRLQVPKSKLVGKTLKRGAIIFLLGILLGMYPEFDWTEIRYPGVLQRIALVFVACAFLYLYTSWRTQAWVGALLLLGYWGAMVWVPVPGLGTGVLEPGANLAAWIDRKLIPGVMWQGNWDPEGILSTLPAIASGITGLLAGKLLSLPEVHTDRKITWLFCAGLLAFGLGTVWGWAFPLNKNLWSSSYVLYTSGLAAMILAFFMCIVDVLGYVSWAFVGIVFGTNAIAAYVIGGILPAPLEPLRKAVVDRFIAHGEHPRIASLLWAIGICALTYLIVWVLYKRKIFIKV